LPLALARGLLDVLRYVFPAALLPPCQIPLSHLPQVFHVLQRHHPAVSHKHHALQPEPPPQVVNRPGHRGLVQAIPREHVMRDGPAVHHHYAHYDLPVTRLAVRAVAELAQLCRALPFEVGRGDVIEHQEAGGVRRLRLGALF